MPIISSIVADEGTDLGNGFRMVRCEFTDHLGESYPTFGYTDYPITTSANNVRLFLIPRLEAVLARREHKSTWRLSGQAMLDAILAPQHTTIQNVARYVIRRMMESRSPEDVIRCREFVNHIKANYTAAQIRTLLNITNAQLTTMNSKTTRVLDANLTGLTYAQARANIEASLEVEKWAD